MKIVIGLGNINILNPPANHVHNINRYPFNYMDFLVIKTHFKQLEIKICIQLVVPILIDLYLS